MDQVVNLWLYPKGLRTCFPENNRSYIKNLYGLSMATMGGVGI